MVTFSFCFMVWVFLTQAWRCSSINCLTDTSNFVELPHFVLFRSFGALLAFWSLVQTHWGWPLDRGGDCLDKHFFTICTNIVYNLYKYTGWLRGGGEVATVSEKKGASCQRRLQHPPTIRPGTTSTTMQQPCWSIINIKTITSTNTANIKTIQPCWSTSKQ